MRIEFPEGVNSDTKIAYSLTEIYRDNQRNCLADPIKYWIMTEECFSKLRLEVLIDQYTVMEGSNSEWKFYNIPIATLRTNGMAITNFVEAVW